MILTFMDELLNAKEFIIFIRVVLALALGALLGLGKEYFVKSLSITDA